MENPCFVPVTSAEHAISVVKALRSKNRSFAELQGSIGSVSGDGDDCCHEARKPTCLCTYARGGERSIML